MRPNWSTYDFILNRKLTVWGQSLWPCLRPFKPQTVAEAAVVGLPGSKRRVGTLGSVRFWQQWRETINIKQPYITVSKLSIWLDYDANIIKPYYEIFASKLPNVIIVMESYKRLTITLLHVSCTLVSCVRISEQGVWCWWLTGTGTEFQFR